MSKITSSRRKSPRSLSAEVRQLGSTVNAGAAVVGVEFARIMCPVSDNNEPGHVHLRDTIRFEVDEQTGAATIIAGDPERGVNHALLVEFGYTTAAGHHVPARNYFAFGVETAREEGKRLAEVKKPRG